MIKLDKFELIQILASISHAHIKNELDKNTLCGATAVITYLLREEIPELQGTSPVEDSLVKYLSENDKLSREELELTMLKVLKKELTLKDFV